MKNIRFPLLFTINLMLGLSNLFSVWAEAPKRAKIVYTSNRHGNAEIYIMNADGRQQIRLTNHPGNDFDPTWSPTGEHIAFVSEREHKGLYDIYLMDPDGGNIRRAFSELDYRTAPTWAPDGKKIAYHTYSPVPDWAVYFNTINGRNTKRVVKVGKYPNGFPAWSPDGTEIAYIGTMRGAPIVGGAAPIEQRIWIINLQTHEKAALPVKIRKGSLMYPAWSPDGKKLAFAWRKRDGENPGIYIVNRDGKNLEEITENAYGMIAWSPDGKELLYRKTVGGQKQLLKINLHSRISTPLVPLGPTIRHGRNTGWDWFDPQILPVSPQPQSLTTTWGKIKIQD